MRTTHVAGVLAGLGLFTAACGLDGGHHVRAAGQSTQSPYQQSLAFSKCMRSHGDPSWPDPGPGGAFPNENGSLDKSSPQFKKASAACKNVQPGGPAPADLQQDYKRLLKFSACMRAHGVPKFPDPTLEDHGVGIKGDIDINSPQFKKANDACRSIAPDLFR
jgi:hypothetical protein